MRRAPQPGAGRILAPALLVVGVALASLTFAARQPARRPREQSAGATDRAAAAHAAAGVQPGGGGASLARFQERLRAAEARAAAQPDSREAALELARLLHDGHRPADAVAWYERAIELDPANGEAWYDLAAAHGTLGSWDAAADVLQKRLEDAPADAVALHDLGAVRANQGRMAEAVELFERALGRATDGALRARISEALARAREG